MGDETEMQRCMREARADQQRAAAARRDADSDVFDRIYGVPIDQPPDRRVPMSVKLVISGPVTVKLKNDTVKFLTQAGHFIRKRTYPEGDDNVVELTAVSLGRPVVTGAIPVSQTIDMNLGILNQTHTSNAFPTSETVSLGGSRIAKLYATNGAHVIIRPGAIASNNSKTIGPVFSISASGGSHITLDTHCALAVRRLCPCVLPYIFRKLEITVYQNSVIRGSSSHLNKIYADTLNIDCVSASTVKDFVVLGSLRLNAKSKSMIEVASLWKPKTGDVRHDDDCVVTVSEIDASKRTVLSRHYHDPSSPTVGSIADTTTATATTPEFEHEPGETGSVGRVHIHVINAPNAPLRPRRHSRLPRPVSLRRLFDTTNTPADDYSVSRRIRSVLRERTRRALDDQSTSPEEMIRLQRMVRSIQRREAMNNRYQRETQSHLPTSPGSPYRPAVISYTPLSPFPTEPLNRLMREMMNRNQEIEDAFTRSLQPANPNVSPSVLFPDSGSGFPVPAEDKNEEDLSEERINKMTPNQLCCICQTRYPRVTAVPCGHRSYCVKCSRTFANDGIRRKGCSICRAPLTSMMRVYGGEEEMEEAQPATKTTEEKKDSVVPASKVQVKKGQTKATKSTTAK